MSARRVLAIVLAEADPDLLQGWVAEGRLPTFARLMEEGMFSRLRKCLPASTAERWATLVTGRGPGHHGIYDFFQRGEDGRFREARFFGVGLPLTAPAAWEVLAERGVACGLVNVPFVGAGRPRDGFLVLDVPEPQDALCWPADVERDVRSRFGAYDNETGDAPRFALGDPEKDSVLNRQEIRIARQAAIAEQLMAERDWRFLLTRFEPPAFVQHSFWSDMENGSAYRDAIRDTYVALDRAVARLWDAAGPGTAICVVSDCGAGPLRQGVQMHAWLEAEGYLARSQSAGNVARGTALHLRAHLDGLARRSLPDPLYAVAKRGMRRVHDRGVGYPETSDLDWSNTRAFGLGRDRHILVNLRGRDPHGIVRPGAPYESLRDEIAERLLALVDPATGERPALAVHRGEELSPGPRATTAPDLVVHWNPTYWSSDVESEPGAVFAARVQKGVPWPNSGGHRDEGIWLAAGPGVPEWGPSRPTATLLDVVPSWFALLGEPIPAELEGRGHIGVES